MSPELLDSISAASIRYMDFPLADLLENSLYYPCSGIDGTPIRHWQLGVSSFVYADFFIPIEEYQEAIKGLWGYEVVAQKLIEEEQLGIAGWQHVMPSTVDAEIYRDALAFVRFSKKSFFALWSILERKPMKGSDFGPSRFSLLHIRAEGIATYNALYASQGRKPKIVCFIRPGLAFGFNYSGYEDALAGSLLSGTGGIPEQLLYEHWLEDCDAPCKPFDILYKRKLVGPLLYDGNDGFVSLFSTAAPNVIRKEWISV